jgi:hypothetical protein
MLGSWTRVVRAQRQDERRQDLLSWNRWSTVNALIPTKSVEAPLVEASAMEGLG